MKKFFYLFICGAFQLANAAVIFEFDFEDSVNGDFETDSFVSQAEVVPNQWFRSDTDFATFGLD